MIRSLHFLLKNLMLIELRWLRNNTIIMFKRITTTKQFVARKNLLIVENVRTNDALIHNQQINILLIETIYITVWIMFNNCLERKIWSYKNHLFSLKNFLSIFIFNEFKNKILLMLTLKNQSKFWNAKKSNRNVSTKKIDSRNFKNFVIMK